MEKPLQVSQPPAGTHCESGPDATPIALQTQAAQAVKRARGWDVGLRVEHPQRLQRRV